MTTKHLSDSDIQNFAFDQTECETKIVNHIQSCNICKKRVETYLSLSDAIKNQPQPITEFNVVALVMEKLPPSTKKVSVYVYFIYFTITASFGVVVSTLYLLFDVFKPVTLPNYFIVSMALFILLVLSMDMLRSFNKNINRLNYYD